MWCGRRSQILTCPLHSCHWGTPVPGPPNYSPLHENPPPSDGMQSGAGRVRRNPRRYSQDDLSGRFSSPRQKNLREISLLIALCPKHIVKVPILQSTLLQALPSAHERGKEVWMRETMGFTRKGTPLGGKSERSWREHGVS